MTKIKSKRCRIFSVVRIHECGTTDNFWVEKITLRRTMEAPVIWNGQPAQLHFRNYGKNYPINQSATDLFARVGFVIRGPVLIRTGDDIFYCVTTLGDQETVEDSLDGLGLSETPIVIPVEPWMPRSNIYVRDQNDAFAVKMRLP